MSQSASWEAFQIQLPGQDLLEGVRNVLETLLTFLEIAKAILETIKQFLVDFGNPLIALLEALITLILDLFKALQQTGLYAYYDLPDPVRDPNFKSLAGGFQAFKTRWKGSLLDLRDSNRPQPVAGALQGGFFIIVLDSDGPLALIQLVKSIMSFFRNPKRFIAPQYPAPVHVKALPLSAKGDPVLALADMFDTQVTDLAIEWQHPGTVPTGDVGFAGTTSQIVQNLVVPNWLIEIGTSPPTHPITITPDIAGNFDTGVMTTAGTTGRLVQVTTTPFTDPRNLGSTFTGLATVTDEYGDPVIKMSYYAIVNGFSAFAAAQLGIVKYVFSNVPLDTDLYIRVRAFFGTLATLPYQTPFVNLDWSSPLVPKMGDGSGVFYLPWPSATSTQMSMGKPSAMIHARLPSIPNIDVLGDLNSIFQAAFSLNFHVPLPPGVPELNPQGQPLLDNRGNPIYFPQFDSAGNPLPPLTTAAIGEGAITDMAGSVAGNIFVPPPSAFTFQDYQPDPVTGKVPQQPWQTTEVRFQAQRLAIRFGSILMEQGGPMLTAFKTLMRGPLPAGAVSVKWPQGIPTTLEQLVTYMTTVTVNESTTATTAQVQEALAEAGLNSTAVTFGTAQAYGEAFSDASTRKNVVAAISFLRSLNYQGSPPDWISVSMLDLIPWSGQILYDLIAKIQALTDAYKGVTQEITDFINLLERKINTLEQFIEYLLSILNYLLNLEVGFFLLPVPSIEGDVTSWLATIDNATGNAPSSGPAGYTAGICLAYLAPDVSSIAAAFKLLF